MQAGVGLRRVDQQYPIATNQLEDDGMQQLSFLALYERFREFSILNKKAELPAAHLCFENYFVGISLMLFQSLKSNEFMSFNLCFLNAEMEGTIL